MEIHTRSLRRQTITKLAATPLSPRRKRTRTKLLDAGSVLIIEKGILGTSVGDICERADFSRGAFYSNFADMDHFIQTLADNQWASIMIAMNKAFSSEDIASARETSEDATITAVGKLAQRILDALPLSRDFYLLAMELTIYLARSEDKDTPLREGANAFKEELGHALEVNIAAIGREYILPLDDTTELILAAAERSMNLALSEGKTNLTEYLVRVLPQLLVRLTRPIIPTSEPQA